MMHDMGITHEHMALASMNAPELILPMQEAAPVPSPCVSLCKIDAMSGLCDGCWRSIDEIVHWSGADDHFKRSVWTEIGRRKARALPGQS